MPDGVAWLFCPAGRPDRFAKAAAVADVVILDLEDGVAAADRETARVALIATPLDPDHTVVRINPVGTPDHPRDLEALDRTPYRTLMLAKAENPEEVAALAPRRIVALCETPAGILASAALAAVDCVDLLMWGAEDLIAGIGGLSSRDAHGRYRDVARHARSSVLLAAAASGKPALDSVYLDIADLDGLSVEATDAAASGFAAKACIHPSQVAVVQGAFRPSPEAFAWAERVLAAATGQPGVFAFEGHMVDEPVLRQAHHIVAQVNAADLRRSRP
jgi:citrate lyase subunit beta / citryl-CoA lyase